MKSFITLYVCVILASCSPIYRSIDIDVRIPVQNTIDSIENKSFAVYIPFSGTTQEHRQEHAFTLQFALGMASRIEQELGLSENAVYVYNHYPEKDSVYTMEYIQSLSRQADSDIVILIDSMSFFRSKGERKDSDKSATTSLNGANYMVSEALGGKISVYDGVKANVITQVNLKDTIISYHSRILSEEECNSITAKMIMPAMGEYVAGNFFVQWQPDYRQLFVYPGSVWRKAFSHAEKFEWEKAIELWKPELYHIDTLRAACAAVNIAVGCEMLDRLELALEWLDVAEKISDTDKLSLDNYKQLLEQKIRKKKVGL